MQETEKKENAFPSREFVLRHYLLYVTPFLNKTSLSKFFCLSRSGFHKAIYDAFTFFLVLAFFGAFEMTIHVIQWSIFCESVSMILNS